MSNSLGFLIFLLLLYRMECLLVLGMQIESLVLSNGRTQALRNRSISLVSWGIKQLIFVGFVLIYVRNYSILILFCLDCNGFLFFYINWNCILTPFIFATFSLNSNCNLFIDFINFYRHILLNNCFLFCLNNHLIRLHIFNIFKHGFRLLKVTLNRHRFCIIEMNNFFFCEILFRFFFNHLYFLCFKLHIGLKASYWICWKLQRLFCLVLTRGIFLIVKRDDIFTWFHYFFLLSDSVAEIKSI